MQFSKEVSDLFEGDLYDSIVPLKNAPYVPNTDARTALLRSFKKVIQEVQFQREGGQFYKIPSENILLEFADYEKELEFPSIAFTSTSEVELMSPGLSRSFLSSSEDIFGQNTILEWIAESTETLEINLFASQATERRAMLLTMLQVFTLMQRRNSLILKMPDYYSARGRIMLLSHRLSEEEVSGKNLRVAVITVELDYPIYRLVDTNRLNPVIALGVQSA